MTGSNAVNVFLGLGLSWTLGAVYWLNVGVTAEWMVRYPQIVDLYQARGTPITIGSKIGLAVPSGDLALGVIVFSVNAIICITVLLVRRLFFGGELGSRMRYPTAAFFVLLVRVRRIEASRPRPPCPRPHKPGLWFFFPFPYPVFIDLRSPASLSVSVSLRAPCLSALRVFSALRVSPRSVSLRAPCLRPPGLFSLRSGLSTWRLRRLRLTAAARGPECDPPASFLPANCPPLPSG